MRQSGHCVWLATQAVAALTNTLCPTLSSFAARKKRVANIQVAKEQFGEKKKNLLPEYLTKRLAYLQYAQSATTHVAQFKIHDSCQKKKKKTHRTVSRVAAWSRWCIPRQFFEVDSTTLKLGAFFGRSNSRASVWLAPLCQEDTPGRMHADVKPRRRQADLLCYGSAGRSSFQGESALPYSHLSPATSNFNFTRARND